MLQEVFGNPFYLKPRLGLAVSVERTFYLDSKSPLQLVGKLGPIECSGEHLRFVEGFREKRPGVPCLVDAKVHHEAMRVKLRVQSSGA